MSEDVLTFKCACCGRVVTGLPDLAYDAPYHYQCLSDEERSSRAKLNSDFCVIDDRDWFIRGVCMVPIRGTDELFGWGVWVSLSAENFARYKRSFRDPAQSKLGGFFGWFCNRLPLYPDTLHLRTDVLLQDGNQRPMIKIQDAHSDHPLYVDQRDGITRDRLGEIYAHEVCRNRLS
jgi:hypothetical protein